jgi:hypothetical protein
MTDKEAPAGSRTLSRTASSSRAVLSSSSKPLRRQLTWGDNGSSKEWTTISKQKLEWPNVGPQQPPNDNPFLIPSADSGDEISASGSHISSDSSSSLVRYPFVMMLRETDITVNLGCK